MKKFTSIAIAWFKTKDQGRYGKIKIIRYFQIRSCGTIQVLDVSRNYLNNQRSFGGLPISIESTTQEEWHKNVKKLISRFKATIDI